jgi:hypothetical protein
MLNAAGQEQYFSWAAGFCPRNAPLFDRAAEKAKNSQALGEPSERFGTRAATSLRNF